MVITNKMTNLAIMLGMPALSGAVPLLAARGMMGMNSVLMLAVPLIVGPGALMTAALLDGAAKERALAAMSALLLAGILIVATAIIGPKLIGMINIDILRISGGIAIIAIALAVMGLKIPEITPVAIMALGAIIAMIWR